jgi:hypothetical protein
MSSIANFHLLPKTALAGLMERIPNLHEYLLHHGRDVVDFDWSGYVMIDVLDYLKDQQLDLWSSEHDTLAEGLSGDSSVCFLTWAHRQAYLERLDPSLFTEHELKEAGASFADADDEGGARCMRDGIAALQTALRQVTADSVVLLHIG